jgi:hypothetical protein
MKELLKIIVSVSMLCIVVMWGCKETGVFLPLNEGNRWEYQLSNGDIEVYTITGETESGNTLRYRCEITRGDISLGEVYFFQSPDNSVDVSFYPPHDPRILLIPPDTVKKDSQWSGGDGDIFDVEMESFEKKIKFRGNEVKGMVLILKRDGELFSRITLLRNIGIVSFEYYRYDGDVLSGGLSNYIVKMED